MRPRTDLDLDTSVSARDTHMLGLTVDETEEEEECHGNHDGQVLHVAHLDSDEDRGSDHHSRDGETAHDGSDSVQSGVECYEPVGVGESCEVLEGGDDDDGRNHHWRIR